MYGGGNPGGYGQQLGGANPYPQQGGWGQQPGYPQPGYQQSGMARQGTYGQQPTWTQSTFAGVQPQNPYGGQQMNYRSQNWNGYQMGQYQINPAFIEQYAPGIFQYFDKDRSGSLDMMEVPVMINHLFNYLKMPAPSLYDVLFLMFTFDKNGDGKMDLGEFKAMLYFLAGKR